MGGGMRRELPWVIVEGELKTLTVLENKFNIF